MASGYGWGGGRRRCPLGNRLTRNTANGCAATLQAAGDLGIASAGTVHEHTLPATDAMLRWLGSRPNRGGHDEGSRQESRCPAWLTPAEARQMVGLRRGSSLDRLNRDKPIFLGVFVGRTP